METPSATKDNLFKVFLRLRPPPAGVAPSERFLTVEPQSSDSTSSTPTHVTLTPPSNARKHATEKYCFTQVLEEDASQLDVFQGTGVIPLIEGVLGPNGGDGTDALLATLGVTGAGKVRSTDVLLATMSGKWLPGCLDNRLTYHYIRHTRF